MNDANKYIHLLDDGVDELIDGFTSIIPEGLEGLGRVEEATSALGLDRLLSEAVSVLTANGSALASFLFTLLGLSLLIALVDKLGGSIGEMPLRAVTILSCTVLFFSLLPLFREAEAVLVALGNFFSALCGITVGITAMGGGVSSSSAQAVSCALIARLFGSVGASLSLVASVLFVLTILSSMADGGQNGLYSFVKSIFSRGMGILVACLGGFTTLQTVVCGIADSATMRTAKYAVGNLVPVVGSTISGALSTLAGGLEYAMGVVGGGGIAVILTLSLSPLVLLLGYRLCFFIAICFLELCSCSVGAKCLSAISAALDSLIAVFALTTVIYLYELLLFIIGGVFVS